MQKTASLRLFLLVTALLILINSSYAIKLGSIAPMMDEQMMNVDGKMLAYKDVKGEKGTLVVFSCNHCPYVIAWEERITQIGNKYQEMGFGVLVINSNDPKRKEGDGFEGMQARAKKLGLKFPYVVDVTSGIARAYGAERTPEVFLFNADNKLVYHGAVDDNAEHAEKVQEHYLVNALDALAEGGMVAKPETKAIGCSIKFRKGS